MEITATKTTLGELQPGELFILTGQENIEATLRNRPVGMIVNLRTTVPIPESRKDAQVYRLTVAI